MIEVGAERIVINTPVIMREVTAPAYVNPNTIKLYAKDKSGVSHLYYMDDDLVEHDLAGAADLPHTLLNATAHTDSATQTVSRGSLVYGNSTPKWDELVIGTTGQYLGTDGTDVSWRAQSTLDHGSIGGLSDDDHTQYVLRSILTTNGDLFTRAAGVIARLGIGTDDQVLTVVSGAPAWADATGGGGSFDCSDLAGCSIEDIGTIDHDLLDGLTDDDHTIYALLAGRSGGQVLKGGTGSGEDITIRSTTHATKGTIRLADEGGNVVIGGAATASYLVLMEPSGSGSNYIAFKSPALSADVIYTLPPNDGSAQEFLKTDGSGTLQWAKVTASGSGDVIDAAHLFMLMGC